MLFVQSAKTKSNEIWKDFPKWAQQTIKKEKITVLALNTVKIAKEVSSRPDLIQRMQGIVLLGIFLKATPFLERSGISENNLMVMPKKTSTKPVTNSRKNTRSKTSKKKKLEATTDTAWEKLASTQKTSLSKTEKNSFLDIEKKPSETSDKFPWESFPIRLDIKQQKRVCWFQCEDHLNKLILREQLTPKDYIISTNGVDLVGLPKPKRRRKTK